MEAEFARKYAKTDFHTFLRPTKTILVFVEFSATFACTPDDDDAMSWDQYDFNQTVLECACSCKQTTWSSRTRSLTFPMRVPASLNDVAEIADTSMEDLVRRHYESNDDYPFKCRRCEHELIVAKVRVLYKSMA